MAAFADEDLLKRAVPAPSFTIVVAIFWPRQELGMVAIRMRFLSDASAGRPGLRVEPAGRPQNGTIWKMNANKQPLPRRFFARRRRY